MDIIRFDTHGWRARVDEGLDQGHVARIADALGRTWARRAQGSTVMVGYDTRRDSRRLARTAAQALSARGMQAVVSDRPCTTPALDYAIARDAGCAGGVMLTAGDASHKYGGLLARQYDGGPVGEGFAEAVEQSIAGEVRVDGGSFDVADLVSAYNAALMELVGVSGRSRRVRRVVLDTMYGAAQTSARPVLEHLGLEVISLHDETVADFRGLHPKAEEPWVDECERLVCAEKADLGVVINGDGSRIALIDEAGQLISRHDLAPLALMQAASLDEAHQRVVATQASSVRLQRTADALGLPFTMVPLGFGSVYLEFFERDVALAADEQGDVCIPRHIPDYDGLLGACLAVRQLMGSHQRVSKTIAAFEESVGRTQWAKASVRLDPSALMRLRNLLPGINPQNLAGTDAREISHADGLRMSFDDGSWVLLSTSSHKGATLWGEAPTGQRLEELLKSMRELALSLAVA